jgi:hypothetical protein
MARGSAQPAGVQTPSRAAARAGRILVLAAAAIAAGACKQREIDVVVVDDDLTGGYGRHALRAAVEKFRATPRSPEAYRALAVEIERLRPSFNQDVADEAERSLVFLALGPMAAQLERPVEEQMLALALTVWPSALHVEPKPGESAGQYLERACAGPLAADCKYVVPEYWPLILSHRVWRRFKDRARDAYSSCRRCAQEPSYASLLEQYDQHESALARRASDEKGRADRKAWPEGGPNAREWSGAPVLDLLTDPPQLSGEPIEGDWRARVGSSRRGGPGAGQDVLGLHLRPSAEVRHLRDVLRVAAAAGYREIALQARRRAYPYALVEYRLATRGAGRAVPARDVDTIQFLVRTLDASAARTGARTLRAPEP